MQCIKNPFTLLLISDLFKLAPYLVRAGMTGSPVNTTFSNKSLDFSKGQGTKSFYVVIFGMHFP